MAYIFLDESGDFSKKGDNQYFVVASFMVDNPKRTYNDFRVWTRSKMPRVMRNLPEVKFSNKNIDELTRRKTLKMISSLGVRIIYSYVNKSNIPDKFWRKRSLMEGELYAHIVLENIKKYLPIIDHELRVYCDERSLKNLAKNEFKGMIELNLASLMLPCSIVQLDMIVSQDNPNIQIADWIVGALASYCNEQKSGRIYFEILKDNIIVVENELFKNQWLR